MRWYVVHAYSGFEKSVARNLVERIERAGMKDRFGEILVPVEEVVEIDVEAGNFSFSPNEITVKLGQTVRINLTAADLQHNFSLDEFDVSSEIVAEGESTTVEFLADQTGEFEFYCNVGSHRAQGQVGTLIIEE